MLLLQPMDQGVLENIMHVYCKELLSKLTEVERGESVIDLLKTNMFIEDDYLLEMSFT